MGTTPRYISTLDSKSIGTNAMLSRPRRQVVTSSRSSAIRVTGRRWRSPLGCSAKPARSRVVRSPPELGVTFLLHFELQREARVAEEDLDGQLLRLARVLHFLGQHLARQPGGIRAEQRRHHVQDGDVAAARCCCAISAKTRR